MSILQAVIQSFQSALALVFAFVPKLVGFLVIILIGWIVGSALDKAVTFLLRKVGFDRLGTRIGLNRLEQQMGIRMDAAGVLGKIVYWFVFLIFLVPAVDTLGLTTVSGILDSIIAFIPNIFVAILILFLGTLAATFIADIIRGGLAGARVGNAGLYANLARYAIIVFVALMALEQLNIASSLLNILFTAIVGAAALAFGLAFGLGGRETAHNLLDRTQSSLNQASSQISAQQSAQQSINQARNVGEMQAEQYRNRQYTQQPNYPPVTPSDR